ncbi:MAG: tetratricopeptide repeat protein [Phycisphaerae bacterium]|nr:tetratricopeptide repeat protein [Phycisphaerae bacterium]
MKDFRIRQGVVACILLGLLAGCEGTTDPISIYNTGLEQYEVGEYDRAIGMFKWSLEEGGREFKPALLALAKTHLALARRSFQQREFLAAYKDLETALNWANQAINADPGNPETFRVKVAILKMRGEVEGVLVTARRAAELVGPSPSTVIMLARTYREQGDYDNAVITLKQGLSVSPDNVELNVELARLYDTIGRGSLALEHYERAYRLAPDYPGLEQRINRLRTGTDGR